MRTQWCTAPLLLCFALWQLAVPSQAQELCRIPAGQFASIDGTVEVRRGDTDSWEKVTRETPLCVGNAIRVGERSRAAVHLVNDAVLRIDQNTTMRLLNISGKEQEQSLLELVKGAFQCFSRKPRVLKINTPYLNGLIEGTEFVAEAQDTRSTLTVLEGRVTAANEHGSVVVEPGTAAVGEPNKAPQLEIVVRPRDAVHWGLYYPPVLAALGQPGSSVTDEGVAASVRQALQQTDRVTALAMLEQVPEAERDATFHLYRAALLLSVGRVAEANVDIDAALQRDPEASLAYALRSVILVVQNERERGLVDAERAVSLGATPAASIALSYAQQAQFQIDAARDTLQAAVVKHPDDPLLWARLGELWLMLGDRKQALAAARKAQALAPGLARTQLVLGFAALAEFRNEDAASAFGRALELDSSDPLAHLGLGLTKISKGKLVDGRRELEIAVALDSSNALARSYLGKAYFEEKRTPLDSSQYLIAKSLDPLDPTPYLYDGILKQTANQPVEALRELQASIDRNDNRSVYRSRLSLDEDRAARGTSLARVYNDLSFSQLGVREATSSLALDRANASAHRFLADTYQGLRRHEIARVSELLQAQLLQDNNINPVQPSVAETNLNVVATGGPAGAGFNEFTPLFQRSMTQFNLSGYAGNHDTHGAEGVGTLVRDRLSLSAGAFRHDSDGWRTNNALSQNIQNVYAQVAITPRLNVQAEFRRRRSEEGDLAFNFDPENFLRDKTVEREQDTSRVGLRVAPTPRSTLLLSYIHSNREEKLNESELAEDPLSGPFTLATDGKVEDDTDQFEGQYIYRRDKFNIVAGAAYSKDRRDTDVTLSIPEFLFSTGTVSQKDIKHSRGYLYADFRAIPSLTWTLGVSYDDFKQEPLRKTWLNPKLGVQWNATDNLRLRAAAFRSLKPALANNRSIEPTQIAGFNQVFDDINATLSRRYGAGIDWRVARNLYVGGEATRRRLEEPVSIFDENGVETVQFEKRDERFHHAYLYWTPHASWAVKAELAYDRYTSAQGTATEFDNLPEEVVTMSAPLGLTYFHPRGFFAGVSGTYVDQEVRRAASSTQGQGQDRFFLVDAMLGYRFPKRFGLVSLGIKNLFGTRLRFQDDSFREFRDEPATGPYFPERVISARITLNF